MTVLTLFRKERLAVMAGGKPQLGATCWTRTNDPAVNSRMLYRLS